jgi:hypothetical protein
MFVFVCVTGENKYFCSLPFPLRPADRKIKLHVAYCICKNLMSGGRRDT